MRLPFDALRGTDGLFSNQLETERRAIDLPINVKLLPEDHQAQLFLKSQIAVWQELCHRDNISQVISFSVSPPTLPGSDPAQYQGF